ncbi:MAG: hypothetical protein HY746_00395 [Elusimicrobia bacterium]|nr:hypothetical protein [Elusimicrobiota bacterium]
MDISRYSRDIGWKTRDMMWDTQELARRTDVAKGVKEKNLNNQTKFGLADAAWGIVAACIVSHECREDVVNYINNLHDDENDTYHNNMDGANPNYEVYKKVK